MRTNTNTSIAEALRAENTALRARLDEVEQTHNAIRTDVVDAFVIETARGPQVFTLQGLDAGSTRFRETILEQINDAVIVADDADRVVYVNKAAERLYGVAAEDVIGKRLNTAYETRWLLPTEAADASATLRITGRWRGAEVHVRHDGEEIEVESSVSALPVGDDGSVGTLRVIRDRSQVRRLERSLALLEARLEAAERWRAVRELALRVADDVGTPRPADPPPDLHEARRRVVDLVDELIAVGGPLSSERVLLSVSAIVEESARLLRAGPLSDRRLECTAAPDTPLVRGDAAQLLQAMLSVGTNAGEAMRGASGSVVIRVSGITVGTSPGKTGLPPGRYARIEVNDTGPGMDPATQRQVFEPSFSTKPAGKGRGYGLSDVRRVMRQHHGEVVVETEPGQGCRFELYLPSATG